MITKDLTAEEQANLETFKTTYTKLVIEACASTNAEAAEIKDKELLKATNELALSIRGKDFFNTKLVEAYITMLQDDATGPTFDFYSLLSYRRQALELVLRELCPDGKANRVQTSLATFECVVIDHLLDEGNH